MLTGSSIQLRPAREVEIDLLYEFHTDLENRGPHFPLGVLSQTAFRESFLESGFWSNDKGTLLIVDQSGRIVGHIESFKTVSYMDELELSYQIYKLADRGKGYVTQAVNLMVIYLFQRLKANRIRLIIHPENKASRRVAEKCGFVHEGTARGAWYHLGRNHDVEVYAILREQVELDPERSNGRSAQLRREEHA